MLPEAVPLILNVITVPNAAGDFPLEHPRDGVKGDIVPREENLMIVFILEKDIGWLDLSIVGMHVPCFPSSGYPLNGRQSLITEVWYWLFWKSGTLTEPVLPRSIERFLQWVPDFYIDKNKVQIAFCFFSETVSA